MNDSFVGTWRLVSFVRHEPDGGETRPYGSNPRGCLIYDNVGRMSVQIARSDRRPFTSDDPSSASLEELRGAFDGYFGYFGRYTVDEKSGAVTHHVEGSSYPNFVGTDQRRLFTFQNDRLVLSTPERIGGSDVTYVATWERQE